MQKQIDFKKTHAHAKADDTPLLTLGSLFDGIGGFMVAAKITGIKPLWASEIDQNCIAITKHHFSNVLHLGDITQIDGGKIPPTDIISFGSPCQDLSISGKRKGLSGKQSGMFMEAIRIIREMKVATKNCQPRYAIWENVPGALSSNKGEDFRIILEELVNTDFIEIGSDDNSKIERSAKTGFVKIPKPLKWGNAGSIMGNNGETPYSISWRILDSQYFGVPQRRKRIFVICDFGGRSSEEILFECESLSGNIEQGREEKQDHVTYAPRSVKATDINYNSIKNSDLVYEKTFSIVENIIDRSENSGGNGIGVKEDICYTLTTASPHAVVNCSLCNRSGFGIYKENKVTGTLTAHLGQQGDDLVLNLGSQGDRIYCNAKKSVALTSQGGGSGAKTGMYFFEEDYKKSKGILSDALNTENLFETIEHIIDKEGVEVLLQQGYKLCINGVRRLTPLECERLQGYADNWTNIKITDKNGKMKLISDNARYRALGNSVCVNVVVFLLERLKYCHLKGY